MLVCYDAASSALYVVLVDAKNQNQILAFPLKPIWKAQEQITPLAIEETQTQLIFFYETEMQAQCQIVFERSELMSLLKKNLSVVAKPKLQRVTNNPIMQARPEHAWESQFVFNAAAIELGGKVHFIYRAIGEDGLSTFGYANSRDGVHIDERLDKPVFVTGTSFRNAEEAGMAAFQYASGGSWGGCEDPRLVRVGDRIYMTYTAFSHWGVPPGVALTSISVEDFLAQCWNWQKPQLISPPYEMHKNWVIFPEKIHGQYAVLHSITPSIRINYFDSLDFSGKTFIKSYFHSQGDVQAWDSWIRGVGAPPLKTPQGWLLLYHAMDRRDPNRYKLGAMLLDEKDPTRIIARLSYPLLEPNVRYENDGFKMGVIYNCGAVLRDDHLYVYYGGADAVLCAAVMKIDDLLNQLKLNRI